MNGILIYLIIQKIFQNDLTAFLTFILWIVHPIHTEAITYINGTADPMSLFFTLMSFFIYLKFKDYCEDNLVFSKYILFCLGLFLFLCALMSKESIIVFPLIILVYESFIF